ncbi:MAG: hypothetical protein O2955_22280 [Planctomycetota bacterium]|nr:hypothetical protein [Planctomycetota bacterium]
MVSKRSRLSIQNADHISIISLGEMEIWDGADLALLRETLTRLVDAERSKAVGVDLRSVKYIPSGFFGMLYDWFEKKVEVYLYSPQPNVANMLWFRQFFAHQGNGQFRLSNPTSRELLPNTNGHGVVQHPQTWQRPTVPVNNNMPVRSN